MRKEKFEMPHPEAKSIEVVTLDHLSNMKDDAIQSTDEMLDKAHKELEGLRNNLYDYSEGYREALNQVFRDFMAEIEINYPERVEKSNAKYLVQKIIRGYVNKLKPDIIEFFSD